MYLERLIKDSNPDGETYRAEENITNFRYLLLESDVAPADLWLRALVHLPLPIVSIVSSGGRSFHALVRVAANSSEDWKKLKARLAPALARKNHQIDLTGDENACNLFACNKITTTRIPTPV